MRVVIESGAFYTISVVILFVVYMLSSNAELPVSDAVSHSHLCSRQAITHYYTDCPNYCMFYFSDSYARSCSPLPRELRSTSLLPGWTVATQLSLALQKIPMRHRGHTLYRYI